MSNSEELSLYFSNQLPALLIAHPSFKFMGLKLNQEDDRMALHSIYIEKAKDSDQLPFRALITVAEWSGESDKEEFFLEALTAERLIEKLQRFDEIGSFVFFKTPNSVTMDTINTYPQVLFCKLFPELGEFNPYAPAEPLQQLKARSVDLLASLEMRLKNL
ncbi:MAG: hypothetical protein ACJAT7_000965 [Psychromonas sp.]|jgi:hypothetical protein|uniref:hypothetical protein n=1 Tax=Psychromonas sp. TaxID=1884585 RepID=UPI0039E5C452